MNLPNNPMQILNAVNNPERFVTNLLQQNMGNNPLFNHLFELAQAHNGKEIEKIARNMLKEQGLDFDTEFREFMKNMNSLNNKFLGGK